MIDHRPLKDLGRADHGWLIAHHHFSFADYQRADRMGFGGLRVWNDDRIAAGTGFPPHPHRDMEIMTYVRRGAISHEDHLGNRGRTDKGDVQVMSAGTGIRHAEFNREQEPTEIFQIWVLPNRLSVAPRWENRQFPSADRQGQWLALASGQPEHPQAVAIYADATLWAANLLAGQVIRHELQPGRGAYLVAARGSYRIGDLQVQARDGLAVTGEPAVEIVALEPLEVLLLDVAMG